uniref:LO7 hexon n=1 Tax=Swordtail adomavirus 2 TaxID=2609877 RepID=A0A6F9FCV5_9VIRU|nr:TPA_asm: LO7 hexon [Swordtail adomavirus 2]
MTTSGDDPFDSILASTLSESVSTQYVTANLADAVRVRSGQGSGGSELSTELNHDGEREIIVSLNVEPFECILLGSITLHAKCRIERVGTGDGSWRVGNGTDAGTVKLPNNATMVRVGPYFLNGQFAVVDLELGQSTSTLRAFLPMSRGTQRKQTQASWATHYFTQPNTSSVSRRGCNTYSDPDNQPNDIRNVVINSTTDVVLIEQLTHPLNFPVSLLVNASLQDVDQLKVLPPGCKPRFRLTTGNSNRKLVLTGPDFTLGATFTQFEIRYTTIVPPQTIEAPISRFPVLDVGVEEHPLTNQQEQITIPITTTDSEILPQHVVVLVCHRDTFKSDTLTGRPAFKRAITKVIPKYGGVERPFFCTLTVDGVFNMDDESHVNLMLNAFFGRQGQWSTSQTDRALTTQAIADIMTVKNLNRACTTMGAVCTDPSLQLHREACSGATQGKSSVTLYLQPDQITGLDVVLLIKFQRCDVTIHRQHGQFELLNSGCRPSHVQLQIAPME